MLRRANAWATAGACSSRWSGYERKADDDESSCLLYSVVLTHLDLAYVVDFYVFVISLFLRTHSTVNLIRLRVGLVLKVFINLRSKPNIDFGPCSTVREAGGCCVNWE